MVLGKPSKLIAQRGDGTVQLQWSPVANANGYEIHMSCPGTAEAMIDRSGKPNFTKTGLKNGLRYVVQIIATGQNMKSMPSDLVEIGSIQNSPSFELLATYSNQSDQISLNWTSVPTSSFYQIERCDNPSRNQFARLTTIKDNRKLTFQDRMGNWCQPDCHGHYYRISFSNNKLVPDEARLSNKIFCRTNRGLTQGISGLTVDDDAVSISGDGLTSGTTATGESDEDETNNSDDGTDFTPSVSVYQGDLITQQTDVIVVCASSQFLFDAICEAGGKSVQTSYNAEFDKNPDAPVIDVKADGKLNSKRVFFVPWVADPEESDLRASIKTFVRNAIRRAVLKEYRTIAFPAIGCGQYGCSVSLVARTMIDEASFLSGKHGIAVLFVIQPQKNDIYDEFQTQINSAQQPIISPLPLKVISVPVNQGVIEVHMGDITTQKVDVIIISESSQFLRDAVITAGGEAVRKAYNVEYEKNPNSLLLSTPAGALPSKRIFFVKWEPDKNDAKLRQSLVDLVWTVIQNVMAHKFTSLAFPAIGCGQYACSVDIVVKTLARQMKEQLSQRDLQLTVRFVIESSQQNVYDEFCKQVLATQEDASELLSYQIPSTWQKCNDRKLRFELLNTSDEYKTTLVDFNQAMQGKYSEIIRVERIQNAPWYIQYLAHSQQFHTRLGKNTERRLFHGCPESAVNPILDDCFNRSYAGVNGTLYGIGVYFSADASYSHSYADPNQKNERHMFVARVLIGNTVKGASSMKTRPVGYDSTTDGKHIFVAFHDAQAYAEYLITYK